MVFGAVRAVVITEALADGDVMLAHIWRVMSVSCFRSNTSYVSPIDQVSYE